MSAQTRYRTLISNAGAIYSSVEPDVRATLLQKGLDEIVAAVNPVTPEQWSLIMTDSERLLKVWHAKESTDAASQVVTQLMDLLRELASAPPVLVVSDPPSTPPMDRISHIPDPTVRAIWLGDSDSDAVEEEEVEEEEEGMEVEQMTFRGRTYWHEPSTGKLFANNDDEVGDEVGKLVAGRPVFL